MHSGSGNGFGPGSNIKFETKVKKIEANFLGNHAASSIKKARFCLDPELEPEQKLYLSMNRYPNRKKSLRFHNNDFLDYSFFFNFGRYITSRSCPFTTSPSCPPLSAPSQTCVTSFSQGSADPFFSAFVV
jgi:hypothetical protein